MQTDKLFQEYFQLVPHAVFELLGMTPACPYRYESPVVKTSERRLDGFLEPTQAGCPYYFLEVQGYHDERIYWRGLHPVTRYHEMRADLDGQDWKLIHLLP
jgi:predicted transposase YdaD